MTIVKESPTLRLKNMLAEGWEVAEFHHRAVDSHTHDYSVLLRKEADLAVFSVERKQVHGSNLIEADGGADYNAQIHFLTGAPN
jgi:hypothetical protein